MRLGKAASAAVCFIAFTLVFAVSSCSLGPYGTSSSGSSKQSSSGSASGSSSGSSSSAPSRTTLELPVCLSKSLNPLTTSCASNTVLAPLMYDCLVSHGQDFAQTMMLATSLDISGTSVTVHLRQGVKFTDSSLLTSADVVYSYNLVRRTPSSYYYGHLANIASVYANGDYTVMMQLNSPDALIGNMLDIPIIKNGGETSNDNYARTGINSPPVGSGRYVFSSDSFSGTLTYNKSWFKGGTPNFKTINLVNMINENNVFQSLRVGSVDLMLTDSGSGALSASGLATSQIYLNRMVYVGINSKKAALSDAKVRSGISQAIGRSQIVTSIYSSRAQAAFLPFNPKWTAVARPTSAQASANSSQAQSLFSSAGYTGRNTSGALVTSAGTSLSFSLLTESTNAQALLVAKRISSDLGRAGVVVSVDQEPPDAYSAKLASGSFDMYIGEINISDDMDLSPLLADGGAASYGVPQSGATLAAYTSWRSGAQNVSSVVSAFTSETPFIPICFRCGTISYTKGLSGTITPTLCDIFGGVETWHF
jgi:peptide/nickel transport system substrate-binding protein